MAQILIYIKVFWEILRISLRFVLTCIRAKGKFISLRKLKSYKRSNRVVIIGCGSSVNEFLKIKEKYNCFNYDVMTLSYSGLLDIGSQYNFYEKPRTSKIINEHKEKLLPLLEKRTQNRKDFIFINKDPWNQIKFDKFDFVDKNNLIVINTKLKKAKQISLLLNLFQKIPMSKFSTIQVRGSLFTLINLSKLLGYEEVLLVGFDLDGSEYFFRNNETYKKMDLTDPYTLEDWTPSEGFHFTSDPRNVLTIQQALQFIDTDNTFEIKHFQETGLLASVFPNLCENGLVNQGYFDETR